MAISYLLKTSESCCQQIHITIPNDDRPNESELAPDVRADSGTDNRNTIETTYTCSYVGAFEVSAVRRPHRQLNYEGDSVQHSQHSRVHRLLQNR